MSFSRFFSRQKGQSKVKYLALLGGGISIPLGTIYLFGDNFMNPQTKYDMLGYYYSSLNFFHASYAFSRIGLDYVYGLRGYDSSTDEYYEKRKEIHTRSAKRILSLSIRNKGIYLKFGQYIGNLERIAPKEYTEVLKVLQDSGPQVDFKEIDAVISTDFKRPIKEIFDSFDPKAIAAASLAQVHPAVYKGQKVAVKVQFPTLRSQFDKDMNLMGLLIKTADSILRFYKYKDMNLTKIYHTFRKSLKEELNFDLERKNGEKTRQFFKNDDNIVIPEYLREACSSRVLTMEFVEGARINEKEKIKEMGFDPVGVAKILVRTFSKMIFISGHVHCDAHPGNILVRKNPKTGKPQLILLDHGFYREYDAQFLKLYCRLWSSIITQDYDTMKQISDELKIGKYYKYLPLVLLWRSKNTKKLGGKIAEEDRRNLQKKDLVNFEVINYIMQKIPEHMIFIIRASNLISIHNMTLGGTLRDRFLIFTDSCYRNLYPTWWSYHWAKFILQIKVFLLENFMGLYRKIVPSNTEVY